MTLPLLGIGVLIMLLLMAITGSQGTVRFEPVSQPVHPIITAVADGHVLTILQVYFVAALVAPFLEERYFGVCSIGSCDHHRCGRLRSASSCRCGSCRRSRPCTCRACWHPARAARDRHDAAP